MLPRYAVLRWVLAPARCTAVANGKRKCTATTGARLIITSVHEQAKDAYQKALDLEPDDAQLRLCYDKADIQERKAAEAKRHKFKSRDLGMRAAPARKRGRAEAESTEQSAATKEQKPAKHRLLSFDDDG